MARFAVLLLLLVVGCASPTEPERTCYTEVAPPVYTLDGDTVAEERVIGRLCYDE